MIGVLTAEDAEALTQQISILEGKVAQLQKDFNDLVQELKKKR